MRDTLATLLSLADDSLLAPSRALERGVALLGSEIGARGGAGYLAAALSGRLVCHACWGDVGEAPEQADAEAEIGAELILPLRCPGQAPGLLAFWGVDLDQIDAGALHDAGGLLGLIVGQARVAAGLVDRARELAEHNRWARAQRTLLYAALAADAGEQTDQLVADQVRSALVAESVTLWQGSGDGARLRAASPSGGASVPPATPVPDVSHTPDGLILAPVGGDHGLSLVVKPGSDDRDAEDAVRELSISVAATLGAARVRQELSGERAHRQRAAQALATAQDDERRRISELLHDGPVQRLVGLAMELEALSADQERRGDASSGRSSAAAADAAREVIGELRQAISDLHPLSNAEASIASVMSEMSRRITKKGLQIGIFQHDGDLPVGPSATLAARVLREGVANVLRHADARTVDLRLVVSERAVEVEVRDDGVGFVHSDVAQRVEEGHFGLLVLNERVVLAGGEMNVVTAPGRGTSLRVRLPHDSAGPESPATGSSRAD